jgi:hypothetical protein
MTNDLQSPAPASADGRRGALDFAEEANTSASFASQGKWDKDRANEPSSDKADHQWLWCEDEPGTEPLPGKEIHRQPLERGPFHLSREAGGN